MADTDHSANPDSVGIIVVNWNSYTDVCACLDSLHELQYPNYEVIVVDNGSTDSSGQRLAEEFDWCEFVFNESNRGFGGGCNAGIEHALADGTDHVLLLNPDARVTDGTLAELMAVQRESGAGIVGATIAHQDGSTVNPTPVYFPDMFFYSGYRSNLPIGSESTEEYADSRWFETDRVEGAGVLLTGEILRRRAETVGYYLDDSLFMYGEEVEMSMWCREHDVTSVVATDAIVTHDSDASSSRAFQLYYLTRNRVLIAHRYLDGVARPVFDILYPVTRGLIAVRLLTNGQRGVVGSIRDGIVDGYRHITGQVQ